MLKEKTLFFKIVEESIFSANFNAIKNIEKELKKVDQEIFESFDRNSYKVKDKRIKRLLTLVGEVNFERRRYVNKNTGKIENLVDKKLGLAPNKYIQPVVANQIIPLVIETKSYKTLSKLFNWSFSPSSITRMIKDSDLKLQIKKISESQKTLIISLDGIFLNQNRKQRREHKFAACYTGVTMKGKRAKLVNKSMITFKRGLSGEKIALKLEEFVNSIYGDVDEIIIIGDGAKWITEIKEWMLKAKVRVIDKFHFKFTFNKLFGITRYSKEKIDFNYFLSIKTKKEFRKELLLKFTNLETGEISITENQLKLIDFLEEWFSSWKKVEKNNWISPIEGLQSHICSSLHKNKRLFGEDNILKILLLSLSEFNNWKLCELKESGITANMFYNEEDIFGIDYIEENEDSNVPLIKYGHSSQWSQNLMKLRN